MLTKSLVDKLNEQINHEYYSANLYLQMSAWCQVNGLRGAAFFLGKHAGEEIDHMRKLFGYVNDLGHMAVIGQIDAPPTDYKSVEDIFNRALEHERIVTKKINELVEDALSSKDFATFNFLQWYVSEQREEEVLFTDVVDKIRLLSGEQRGLYFVDKEIAGIAARA